MSDAQMLAGGRRPRNRRARVLPQDVLEWKAQALQMLGWGSRTAEQTTSFNTLSNTADLVQNSAMRGQGEHGATATRPLLKDSGKQFKAFHDRRTAFESANPRTPQMVAELRNAAQVYIDHFAQHSRRQKSDPKNIAKNEACEATIRELRRFDLADQVRALGAPPWDGAEAMQAASLKTSLDIASLPPGEQRAENLGGAHASPAFWINQRNSTGVKEKTFIFKPAAESGQPGFPNGGEPAREALGGRMADMLNGALGMTLPVPNTQMVSVGRESLEANSLQALIDDGMVANQGAYVGSVQQFEATQGEMRGMTHAQRQQIPAQASQELTIFDTIMLNTDRHEGNFLVKAGATPQLVPIDHGLTLPTRGATTQITGNIGSTHNALMSLPGSHVPFTAQAQQSLARLDPDALAVAMKRERQTMEAAHPSTAGSVSDEAIEMSRRSAMFLKLAGPRLTPAAVQVAISRYNGELFDPNLDMAQFDTIADRIITELEDQQDELGEYFQMPPMMQRKMKSDLEAKGWDVGRWNSGNSILTNPAVALRIWKSGMQAPSTTRDPNRRPTDIDERSGRALAAAQQQFPALQIPVEIDAMRPLVEAWRDWQAFGSSWDSLRDAISLLGVRNDNIAEAYTDLLKAVAYLNQAAALNSHLQNANTDNDLFDIAQGIDHLKSILPALAPAARVSTQQVITPIEVALNGNQPMQPNAKQQALTTVRRLVAPLTDAARSRLLAKYDTLIATLTDPAIIKSVKENRFETEAGDLVDGYANILKRDATLANS